MRGGAWVTYFLVMISLVGCDDSDRRRPTPISPEGVEKVFGGGSFRVDSDWAPARLQLNCFVKGGCPPQVGIVLFVSPMQDGSKLVRRCTGFLMGDKQIMTNAHCNLLPNGATGYFVTAKTIRHIERTLFSQNQGPRGPDLAVLQLNAPLTDLEPLKLARSGDAFPERLVGYVINRDASATDRFAIEKIECRQRRHEAFFPLDASEDPDVLMLFGCGSEEGNSGSPLFALGDLNFSKVHAVAQSVNNPGKQKLKRQPRRYDNHWSVVASNVRCYEATKPCLRVEDGLVGRRFTERQQKVFAELQERQINELPKQIAYNAKPFEIVRAEDDGDLEFEVFYSPLCRTEKVIDALPLISERVRLTFDEWATPTLERVELISIPSVLQDQSGDRATLQVAWPAVSWQLRDAVSHPRKAWGSSSFSIELPNCPR